MNLIFSLLLLTIFVGLLLSRSHLRLPRRLVKDMYPEEERSLRATIEEAVIVLLCLGYFFLSVQGLSAILEPTIVSNTFFSCAFFILVIFTAINLHPKGKEAPFHKKITFPVLVIMALFIIDFFLQKFFPGEYYLVMLVGGLTIIWGGIKWISSIFSKNEGIA